MILNLLWTKSIQASYYFISVILTGVKFSNQSEIAYAPLTKNIFEVSNKITRKRCSFSSKLTIKTPK